MKKRYHIAALICLFSATMARAEHKTASIWPSWCNLSWPGASGCSDNYDRKPYPSIVDSLLYGGQNCYDRKPMPSISPFSSCGGSSNYDRKPMPGISPTSACPPATPCPALPVKR